MISLSNARERDACCFPTRSFDKKRARSRHSSRAVGSTFCLAYAARVAMRFAQITAGEKHAVAMVSAELVEGWIHLFASACRDDRRRRVALVDFSTPPII